MKLKTALLVYVILALLILDFGALSGVTELINAKSSLAVVAGIVGFASVVLVNIFLIKFTKNKFFNNN